MHLAYNPPSRDSSRTEEHRAQLTWTVLQNPELRRTRGGDNTMNSPDALYERERVFNQVNRG